MSSSCSLRAEGHSQVHCHWGLVASAAHWTSCPSSHGRWCSPDPAMPGPSVVGSDAPGYHGHPKWALKKSSAPVSLPSAVQGVASPWAMSSAKCAKLLWFQLQWEGNVQMGEILQPSPTSACAIQIAHFKRTHFNRNWRYRTSQKWIIAFKTGTFKAWRWKYESSLQSRRTSADSLQGAVWHPAQRKIGVQKPGKTEGKQTERSVGRSQIADMANIGKQYPVDKSNMLTIMINNASWSTWASWCIIVAPVGAFVHRTESLPELAFNLDPYGQLKDIHRPFGGPKMHQNAIFADGTVAAGLLESEITIDSLPGEVWWVSESLGFHGFHDSFLIWWLQWKKSPFFPDGILPRCWSNWKRKCIFPVVGSNPWAFVLAVLFTSG